MCANGCSESDNEVELKVSGSTDGITIASYSLIKNLVTTLLFSAEYVDQENTNHRYRSNFVNGVFGAEQETAWFITRSGVFTAGSAAAGGAKTANTFVEFTSRLKTQTETGISQFNIFSRSVGCYGYLIITLGGRFDEFDITLRFG